MESWKVVNIVGCSCTLAETHASSDGATQLATADTAVTILSDPMCALDDDDAEWYDSPILCALRQRLAVTVAP